MIRIFNNKLDKVILIDDKSEIVTYYPKQYEGNNPHVLIELKGVDLFRHSRECEDCKAFIDAFGTRTTDWFIEINGKIDRLSLFGFGKEYASNRASFNNSDFFMGTKLKLNIDVETIEELERKLMILEQSEQYEQCCFVRDKMRSLA